MRRFSWWAQCNHKYLYKRDAGGVRVGERTWDSGTRGSDEVS